MYMYIPCTYMFMRICNCMNIYIHVCTMFRHVCTVLPILVQVVRIPDAARRGAGGCYLTRRCSRTCHRCIPPTQE